MANDIISELVDNDRFLPWTESLDFSNRLEEKDLSPEDKALAEAYHKDGFVLLEGLVSPGQIDAVNKDVQSLFKPDIPEGPRSRYRVMDAWKESEAVRRLVLLPEINRVLKLFYEREPVPFQTLNFLHGSQQRTHSDTIHFSSLPARYMCGAWIALEDVTPENGPLHYYPGSHRLPDLDMYDVGRSQEDPDYKSYEDFVEKLMLNKGFERKTALVKKGTVGIWAANLFHGGTPITRPGATRKSLVVHYFFDNCVYYSPMFSNKRKNEFFLNDFDIKLNIQTLRPIRPRLNGETPIFTPLGAGRFRIFKGESLDHHSIKLFGQRAMRNILGIKSRVAIPWKRMRHKVSLRLK